MTSHDLVALLLESVSFRFAGSPPYDDFQKIYVAELDGKDVGSYVLKFSTGYVIISEASIAPEARGNDITKHFLTFISRNFPQRKVAVVSTPEAEPFWKKMGVALWRR
jgi:hypothetical protein